MNKHSAKGTPNGRQLTSLRLTRQFFLGFIRIHILYHAAAESICGVDLSEELGRHGYRLSPGTLYPILHSLNAAGYLRCRSDFHAGRRRKQYRITAAGRIALDRARKQISELVEEVMEKRHA
ncbi:MAG TPA: PadR family transcriptional regulator [Nitrospiraceae bacterium]|nr:PadR family transcriptional regulator [Nitrospiraceae bacterium]